MTIDNNTAYLALSLENYDRYKELQESDPELLQAYILGQWDAHKGLKNIMLKVGAAPLPDYIFQAERIFLDAAKQARKQVEEHQEKQQQEDLKDE